MGCVYLLRLCILCVVVYIAPKRPDVYAGGVWAQEQVRERGSGGAARPRLGRAHCNPYTLHSQPYTLHPEPCTPHPEPHTLNSTP